MQKRKLFLFLAVTLLLLILIILFLPTLFKTQVNQAIRSSINNNLHAQVTFSDAEINLWRNFPQFTVSLENLSVAGEHEFRGDTLVKAKKLNLVASSIALLFEDKIKIKHLAFEEPAFHIVRLHNGRWNFDITSTSRDSLAKEVTDSSGIHLNIKSAHIEGGSFRYEDHETDLDIVGGDVVLDGEIQVNGNQTRFDLESKVENFTTTLERRKYVMNKNLSFDLTGSYDSENNTLTFSDNKIEINHLAIEMNGLYALQDEKHFLDLEFKSDDNDFRDLLSLSDQFYADNFKGMEVEGNVSLSGKLKGTLDIEQQLVPQFSIDFKIADGGIRYQGLPSSIRDINLEVSAENKGDKISGTHIDVKKFKLFLGENPISGFVKLAGLENGTLHSDIKARINLKDLNAIYPMEGVSIDGKLLFDIQTDGGFVGSITEAMKEFRADVFKKFPAFDVVLKIENGLVQYDSLPEAITNINFFLFAENKVGAPDSTIILIEKLEAKFGDNPLSGFVHFKGFNEPFLESEINATLEMEDIKKFYPMHGLDAKGHFKLDFKLSGLWSERMGSFPLTDVQVKIDDGYFKTEQYPFPIEKTHLVLEAFNASGKLEDTMIFIDTLTYSFEDEPFLVMGSITDLVNYKYDLTIDGILYLEKLKKVLHIDDQIKMHGEVDINLKTSGNYEDLKARRYHKLPTEGQLKAINVSIKTPTFNHAIHIDTGHLYFSNEKIFLDTLHGSVGKSEFNLSGHLSNFLSIVFETKETIQGDLLFKSNNFDLNELLTENIPASADTTHHDLVVFKIPENVDFTFDSEIGNLKYKTLVATDVKGEVTAKEGVLKLNNTTFNSMNATFNIHADYDTRNIKKPLFDLFLKVDELDINKAHDAFATIQAMAPAADDTYGIFSIEYKLKGELAKNMYPVMSSLDGGGTLRIREAKVNGMKVFHHISGMTKKEELKNPEVRDIVMETEVSKGVLHVKPFSMKLGGFETDIEGKHNIDGTMNYLLKLSLPPFEMVKIPLHIDGTYDNPKIHLGKGHEDVFKKVTSATP